MFEAYIRKDYTLDKYVANGNIDVLWDFQLLMKLNKFFTASLSTSLIYDDDIKVVRSKYADHPTNPNRVGPAIQFRQILALGFMFDAKSKTTAPKN